jgi:hypothetical protein
MTVSLGYWLHPKAAGLFENEPFLATGANITERFQD